MPSDHTPEWHGRRAKVVGASEVAALYGVQQPYQLSHYALWHVKAGLVSRPSVEGERIEWGNDLEDAIASVAARRYGWVIEKGQHVVDASCPGLGATLDFTITSDGSDMPRGPGALEIKNVDWLQHKTKWTDNEPPTHILLQLQHQLAATGYSWGRVVALVGGNQLEVYEYEAKPKLIADIRKRVTAFWQSIEDNKPPAIDGSDGAFAALRELHTEIIDDAICLDGDNRFPEICTELFSATKARKEAEEKEKALKAELEQKLGPHKRGWSGGWAANFIINPGSPGKEVTQEMVGTVIGARKASRYVTVKEYAA
jgi:predicted phage-related endonuclease